MHRIFRMKAHEAVHGPHFNEEGARKAVSKMENEDGTMGPHWTLEETTTLAHQHGIRLDDRFNKYDWCVALNMIYSDYYRVIAGISNNNNTKNYVEFAKAWLNDKDVEEGKMWYYYVYVMCDSIRRAEDKLYEKEHNMREEYEEDDDYGHYRRGRSSRGMFGRRADYLYDFVRENEKEYDKDHEMEEHENEYRKHREHPEYGTHNRSTRYIRY